MRVDVIRLPQSLHKMCPIDLANALIASTINLFYKPAFDTPERFDRYGAIPRQMSDRTAA